jgi:hypothetical protein
MCFHAFVLYVLQTFTLSSGKGKVLTNKLSMKLPAAKIALAAACAQGAGVDPPSGPY